MTAILKEIYRFPVKGLSGQACDAIATTVGEGLPHDRRFAIAKPTTRFDTVNPEWMPKTNFLQLSQLEKLASLKTHFDDETGTLTIERGGKTVVTAKIAEDIGKTIVSQFFGAYLADGPNGGAMVGRGQPKVVEAEGHMFSDTRKKAISIIGLSSIKDLERVVGQPIDPLRFRANIYLEGTAPWEEFTWVGKKLTIGEDGRGGVLFPYARIDRCAATNVNPENAARDLNLPLALRRGFGHIDMGVYAEVKTAGALRPGDTITVTELED